MREEREIQYIIGDVTQPQNTSTNDAIIVHCVGKEHIIGLTTLNVYLLLMVVM